MAYVVVATWKAKPGEADHVAETLRTVAPINRSEEKLLQFQAHRSTEDPDVFVLYEKYVDATGYDEHKATESFQTHVVGDTIPRLESRNIVTLETLD